MKLVHAEMPPIYVNKVHPIYLNPILSGRWMVRLTLLHSGVCVAQMGHNLYLVEWPSQYRNYKDRYIYDSMVVCAANTTAALS